MESNCFLILLSPGCVDPLTGGWFGYRGPIEPYGVCVCDEPAVPRVTSELAEESRDGDFLVWQVSKLALSNLIADGIPFVDFVELPVGSSILYNSLFLDVVNTSSGILQSFEYWYLLSLSSKSRNVCVLYSISRSEVILKRIACKPFVQI